MSAWSNRTPLLLAVILLATALAYVPGLWGPFVFDDKPNLLANPFIYLSALDWASLRDAAFSNQSGLFRRPIASLSFALNYYAAGGFAPFHFKLTNLSIHLLNGILVFILARQICRRLRGASFSGKRGSLMDLLPFVVTGFWLLHPLQLTSVLYVVQRMNSLSAFFILAGLVLYMAGRARLEQEGRGGLGLMCAGIIGGVGLGVLCKENAALLPVYALILELSCFQASPESPATRRRVGLFFMGFLGVPALAAVVYTLLNPDFILGAYQSRTFTLEERLLTQPRVLFYYLGLALFPSRHALGLFHDDFIKSVSLFEPITTLVSVIGWLCVVVVAIKLRHRIPVVFLGVGWYLGGHLMESSVFGLELVHEHRNYLPLFGILLAASYGLLYFFQRITLDRRIGPVMLVLTAITLGFVTNSRAYSWSSTGVLLETLVKHRPNAARTHGYYAEQIISNGGDIRKAYYHLQQYSRLSPESISGLAEIIRVATFLAHSETAEDGAPAKIDDESSVLAMKLTNQPAQLERIVEKASQEIESRLKAYPISARSVKTFVDLQRCLYEGVTVCVSMAPMLLRWMELALENPRIVPVFRAVLLMSTARVYSWQGEYDKAVDYAENSVELAPKDINLLLDLAKLHLALQNYNRGLEVIDQIKRYGTFRGFREDEVLKVEAKLRAGSPNAAPGDIPPKASNG